jgi:oxygen-dependent protoporphyrinogen oxidase
VSGLTVAYRLLEADPSLDVVVHEAAATTGGKLTSVRVGDLVLPAGADSFVARKPWAAELCRDLGIAAELVGPGTTGAYLWTSGGLVKMLPDAPFGIPGDVGEAFRWPGLSKAGRRRALQDLVRRAKKDDTDESLGSLLRRRLGDEATDRAVGPLLAGLFAGDVDRLSVRATFPELASWEASQGSLIRGSQAAQRIASRADLGPMFLRPKGGIDRLTDVLADHVGDRIVTGSEVTSLERFETDAVVLAVPPHVAAGLLRANAPRAAAELDEVPSASTGVVLMVYPDDTQAGLPDGTGFVVPAGMAPMTAATWLSSKWPSQAFGSRAVVRCYVGGVGAEDILDAPDEDLVEACARHLAAVVALPEAPAEAAVVRWSRAMPQYLVGHRERVARLRDALPPGIFVTGQATDGVGVPDCVRAAGATAEAVLAHLRGAPRPEETVR